MADWTDIHPEFTKRLQKEWEDFGFTYLKVQDWIEKGSLTPEDAGFAYYLAEAGYEPEEMEDENLNKLREFYGSSSSFQPEVKLEEWQKICPNFTPELIKTWRRFGFTLQQVQEWINIGMFVNDADLCAWLESCKKVDSEWVLNFGDYRELQEEFRQYRSLIVHQIQVSR